MWETAMKAGISTANLMWWVWTSVYLKTRPFIFSEGLGLFKLWRVLRQRTSCPGGYARFLLPAPGLMTILGPCLTWWEVGSTFRVDWSSFRRKTTAPSRYVINFFSWWKRTYWCIDTSLWAFTWSSRSQIWALLSSGQRERFVAWVCYLFGACPSSQPSELSIPLPGIFTRSSWPGTSLISLTSSLSVTMVWLIQRLLQTYT